jgi:hypothetical protein
MRCWQGKFTTPSSLMNPINGVCFVASTHILSLYTGWSKSFREPADYSTKTRKIILNQSLTMIT